MNRAQAKKLAYSGKITSGQIKEMLRNAYDQGATDDKRSRVNKSFTRAAAYNIFVRAYKNAPDDELIVTRRDCLGAMNAIREFGEFGPWEIEKPKKKELPELHHEPPIDCPF